MNDVTIGPDGAAYFTDTNEPRIIRVSLGAEGVSTKVFADGTGVVQRQDGFNLGGIVTSADGRSLVVAQGNTGLLWRVDLRTREFTQIKGTGLLPDADGLVREGNTLTVIRNFQHRVTTLRLSPDARAAVRVWDRPSDPDRVLTTAKAFRGSLLAVDSRFEESAPTGDHEIVILPRR